jgi:hypothetical protein
MLQSAGRRTVSSQYAESIRQDKFATMKFKRFRTSIVGLAICALMVAAAPMFGVSARGDQPREYTPEQIAEFVIAITGSRALLSQIRRNGLERGRISRMTPEGRPEESRYELRFVHGDTIEKDKVRIDQKTPQAEYTLVNTAGKVFGIINGSAFTPRAETTADFLSQQTHSLDALLRYKENESKLASAGKDKQQGIDLYVIDLIDKANRKTRYFVSAKTFRVLWLEYEETPPDGSTAIKYSKRFYDYRVAQSTLVPYRTVLFEDGKQTMETRILTVTYGVKMEDSLFQHPDQASSGQ